MLTIFRIFISSDYVLCCNKRPPQNFDPFVKHKNAYIQNNLTKYVQFRIANYLLLNSFNYCLFHTEYFGKIILKKEREKIFLDDQLIYGIVRHKIIE